MQHQQNYKSLIVTAELNKDYSIKHFDGIFSYLWKVQNYDP